MRIQTPVNNKNIRTHFTYNSWKYLIVLVVGIFGWDLVYTTTQYQPPQEKRIDVFVQTFFSSQEIVDQFMEPIWKETVPEMESVTSVVQMPDEVYGQMQYTAYISAGDIDILFAEESYFKSFASNGTFLPLDDLVASGQIQVDGVDLTKGYVTYVEDYESDMKPVVGEMHLYGIPLESFYGFMDGMQIDNRGLYAAILVNNMNEENVIPFFNALLQAGRGDMPEWMKETQNQAE